MCRAGGPRVSIGQHKGESYVPAKYVGLPARCRIAPLLERFTGSFNPRKSYEGLRSFGSTLLARGKRVLGWFSKSEPMTTPPERDGAPVLETPERRRVLKTAFFELAAVAGSTSE